MTDDVCDECGNEASMGTETRDGRELCIVCLDRLEERGQL